MPISYSYLIMGTEKRFKGNPGEKDTISLNKSVSFSAYFYINPIFRVVTSTNTILSVQNPPYQNVESKNKKYTNAS